MKRFLDFGCTLIAVIFLSPLLMVLVIMVRLILGKPVFFRQQRPGLHGRPFTIYKFRTMTEVRDAYGNLLPDGERLTRFGMF
jgi:lipopolysaccharide/colanic/teichoic acid biosynthesis glycosyltransferase